MIISIISNTIVLQKKQNYENTYQDGQNIKETAIVISNNLRKTILQSIPGKIIRKKAFQSYDSSK